MLKPAGQASQESGLGRRWWQRTRARRPPKAKLNKRSSDTIARILAATEEIILRSGAERISILDVCEEVGISRGTFYRYFSSQDDLLRRLFAPQARTSSMRDLHKIAASNDPDERFQALLAFIDDYLENSRARRLLLVAPGLRHALAAAHLHRLGAPFPGHPVDGVRRLGRTAWHRDRP